MAPLFLRQVIRRRPEVGRGIVFGALNSLGYGVRAAHANADVAYQALMAVLSAAQWQVKRGIGEAEATDFPTIEFVYPLVVFDNVLLEYSLGDDGAEYLERRPSAVVAWPVPGRSHFALVHLVTASALAEWVQGAKQSFDDLMNDCEPEAELIGKQWREGQLGRRRDT